MGERPPVRIRFKYNVDNGEVEFIVDDNAASASEEYHEKVTRAVAGLLSRNPEIQDAGPVRQQSQGSRTVQPGKTEEEKPKRTIDRKA